MKKITRRGFLKWMGIGAGAAVTGVAVGSEAAKEGTLEEAAVRIRGAEPVKGLSVDDLQNAFESHVESDTFEVEINEDTLRPWKWQIWNDNGQGREDG